jgi:hypothetical protein
MLLVLCLVGAAFAAACSVYSLRNGHAAIPLRHAVHRTSVFEDPELAYERRVLGAARR